jgi:murein L,D-transpeptidase YafK
MLTQKQEAHMNQSIIKITTIAFLVLLVSTLHPQPPTSPRSTEAINRVKPGLEAELLANGLQWGSPIFIRVFKQEKELEVWIKDGGLFKLFRTYGICTYGRKGLGPKLEEGDGKAPEGFYFVTANQLHPTSRFHLAFNIGYPNRYDRHHQRTGSFIMVHGRCQSDGCFAMTDASMEEIYALADAALRTGQPFFRLHIFPFRMTDRNMQRHRNNEWFSFWENLKAGYDHFELHLNPPDVGVDSGRYTFRGMN